MENATPPVEAPPLKFARAIVFFASFCLMTIEIVASRVVAPYLGVSLYTWTSVIATVLVGVTLGNYAGGRLADHKPSTRLLGASLALGGFATLISVSLTPYIGPPIAGIGLPPSFTTLLFCLIVFFPTAFFLSTVSPQVLKFDLRDLARAGVTIGTIGAWSAIGSILGTFATGFVFIEFMGTKAIMIALGAVLLFAGIAVAWQDKLWKNRLSGVAALFLIGDLFVPSACNVETNYYCIRVTNQQNAYGKSYTLRLDHLVHSFVTPSAPDHLGYGYEQVYANLVAMRHEPADAFSSLFVGGGGYAMPRYLEAYYPSSSNVVSEIDPGVTAVNRQFMELAASTRIRTVNGDARLALAKMDASMKYDFVFGDAFNDFSVPFHLTTVEFHRLLKNHMATDGVYALNIIDDARYGHFLAAMVRTLQTVWTHVYVAPQQSEIARGRNTIVLIATDTPIDRDAWKQAKPLNRLNSDDPALHERAITLLTDEQVSAFLAGHPDPALTDDFVPTDRYLAPVFADAY